MEKGFKTWKVPTYIRIEKISQLSAFKAGNLDVTKSNVNCPRRLFWGSCEETRRHLKGERPEAGQSCNSDSAVQYVLEAI